jgi:hypothetical protein
MNTPQKSLKDVIKEQYQKCAGDPVYFMKKYCKIQHPIRGKIPFELYPFQEDTLTDFKEHRYNIVLKSRQLGISTLVAGYALWKMIFNEDFNVLIIANKQDVAKNLVLKVRTMNQLLPVWLRVSESEDNKLSLRLKNGSQVKAVSSKPDSGRSEALSLLVFDEAAFIDYIDEIWTGTQLTLATGGDCIALSTPNGVGNWFHRMWVSSENGENLFNPIKLHWTVHPDREQDWRDEQTQQLGEKQAAQECDCDFISSGDNVIDGDLLIWYSENNVCDPIEKTGFDNNIWLWKKPDYNRSYVVTADVSRGDGNDYSAFHIIDIESMEQVAEYKGKVEPTDFGNMLISIATDYNDALLIIDNANIGWATIQQILDRDYKNLFWSHKDVQYVDVNTQWTNKYYREQKQMIPGFTISSKTRPMIVSKIDQYMKDKSVIIHSKRQIDELFTFIWHNGRAEAARGYNDDLTMALGIGLWVRDTALRLRNERGSLAQSALNGFVKTEYSPVYTQKDLRQDPYKMNVGKDDFEDLRWLIK